MKRIFLFILLLTGGMAYAQVPASMNYVKYVVIDPHYGEKQALDPHSLVSMLSSTLISSGYSVIMNDESNWPAELRKNPCLGAFATIGVEPKIIGKYNVMFDFEDCDGILMYRAKGGGTGGTATEAFQDAAVFALRRFKKFNLNFQDDKVKVSKSGNRLQFDKEEVMERLNSTVNPRAGLYRVEEGEGKFTLAVLPEGERWQVIVYEEGDFNADEGELLGTMESADISGIFNMVWKKFPGEKTLAKWDKMRLEISQPAGAGQESPLVLVRYVPED